MSNIQSALADFIQQELAVGKTEPVDPEEDLFSSGILDSLGILQLVMFIEERFSVEIPDEDVVFENFHSLAAIEEYLDSRRAVDGKSGETN